MVSSFLYFMSSMSLLYYDIKIVRTVMASSSSMIPKGRKRGAVIKVDVLKTIPKTGPHLLIRQTP